MKRKQEKVEETDRIQPFLDFKTVFYYRGVWMSLAIIWIVLFHLPVSLPKTFPVLRMIKKVGYAGVDIFLFCSGIGCAYSLSKDADIIRFLKRRASRVLPMYLFSLVFWIGYCAFTDTISLGEIIGNVFGHGVLAGLDHQFNWYFGCLWLCYFSAPFFWALVKAYSKPVLRVMVLGLLCLFSLTFVGQFQLILWSRLPIFFLGICAVEVSTRRWGLMIREFLISQILMVIGLMLECWAYLNHQDLLATYGMYWYPFILITPGLCFLISLVAHYISQTPFRPLIELCRKSGDYTLGLCLTHVFVFAVYSYLYSVGYIYNNWLNLGIAVVISLVAAAILELLDGVYRHYRKGLKSMAR